MVATSYPRFDGDPSAIFLRYLVEAIAIEGHTVHILAPNDPKVDGSLTNDK